MKRQIAQVGPLIGAVGAALTSAVTAICCIGPLALTLLGVNGMIFAAGLKPYRFHLLGASALMLALAFWMVYRPVVIDGAVCSPRTARLTKIVLWFATMAWAGAAVLQFVADKIIL